MDVRHGILAISLALTACGGGSSQMAATQTVAPPVKVVPAATEHLLTYGQSLSLGERAVMDFADGNLSIPTDDANVGLMFAGGTRPEDLTSLVPFDETNAPVSLADWNIGTPGETPLYGAMLQLAHADTALHLGSAAGLGGTPIAGLSKGTAPYARLIAQITAAKALSPGDYSVLAVIWMQGESDPGNGGYGGQLAQLFMDIDSDVRAITHQASVQFYICTTADQFIADQQRAVAAANANVHIACDDRDYAKSDGTHLTAAGSRAAGLALGTAIASSL